jgi:hypothetical protein
MKKNNQKKQVKKSKSGKRQSSSELKGSLDNSDSTKSNKRILIVVISNQKVWPTYFANDLFNVYLETQKYYKCDLMIANSCNIENMRNVACLSALGKNPGSIKYDYFVSLDTDHLYPQDFIVKFMKHDLDFVCGLTNRRQVPFTTTQYLKWKRKGLTKINNCVPNTKNGLVEISASGVVGALIKTSVLEKIKFPYFNDIYEVNDVMKEGIRRRGSDVNFTHKLQQAKVKMYCDTSVSFPHEVIVHVDRGEFKPYLG